ncbi:MAG: molybdopterin synthase sulfur carrier subunit [Bacteroidetes bacterium MedPE-SWsnd-G1]|nr:MAG: molybdopterin synthase sulfur carrier subunit [Bacteroidetes bacterium MedPE-SWsnd-G1]
MQIQVLFFGITTDIVGQKSIQFDFLAGMTVADIKQKLSEVYPKLKDYKSFSVAVNMEYATDDIVINANDVIAIIPPVSGG